MGHQHHDHGDCTAYQGCHTHMHCHGGSGGDCSHETLHAGCHGGGDWESEKLEWLIGITKEAYRDLLMSTIREKLAAKAGKEVEELAEMATDKFTGWWQLKRKKIQLKRTFKKRFETFCTGE